MDNIEVSQSEEVSDHHLTEFMQDSLRTISQTYLAWLMFGLLMAIAAYYPWRRSPMAAIWPALLAYYFIALVHVVFRFRSGGRANVFAPDILFLVFYTLFHLGFVTLYGLGLAPYSDEIFFFRSSIPQALLVVNIGLVGFLFGYELMGPKSSIPVIPEPLKIPRGAWSVFGLSVMITALIMHLGALSLIGWTVIERYGYAAIQNTRIYASPVLAMFLSQSNRVIVFGTTIYVVSSALRNGKLFQSKLALGVVLAFFAIYIMEGDRGPLLFLGIPIMLIRHYVIKRIRIWYLAPFAIAVLALFAGIGVVRKTVFDPSKMWQEYKYQKAQKGVGWQTPIIELGGSFQVVNITTHEVPSAERYWKGQSYVSAALHTIPFLEGLFIRRGLRGEHAWWPSKWITATYFPIGWAGRGFTVATEGYLNFGYVGVFFELMLFGLFIRWVSVKFSERPSAAWAFIMLGCIGASVMAIRNYIHVMSGTCLQIFVIAGLVSILCRNEDEPEFETELLESDEVSAGGFYVEYYNC